MKRLEKLREYRSRLSLDCNARVNALIDDKQSGKTITDKRLGSDADFVRKCQSRIRVANAEIDRLIAADPRVLQPAH